MRKNQAMSFSLNGRTQEMPERRRCFSRSRDGGLWHSAGDNVRAQVPSALELGAVFARCPGMSLKAGVVNYAWRGAEEDFLS